MPGVVPGWQLADARRWGGRGWQLIKRLIGYVTLQKPEASVFSNPPPPLHYTSQIWDIFKELVVVISQYHTCRPWGAFGTTTGESMTMGRRDLASRPDENMLICTLARVGVSIPRRSPILRILGYFSNPWLQGVLESWRGQRRHRNDGPRGNHSRRTRSRVRSA